MTPVRETGSEVRTGRRRRRLVWAQVTHETFYDVDQ